MAAQIGVVKAIIGEVTATAADGSIRTLQAGDRVFANELITTGPGGAIEIEFADGSVMDLGRNSQAMLDSEVFDLNDTALAEGAQEDVPDDVAAIQQALLEGQDPTEIGEATAAGAGVEGGNEGNNTAVFVDYLNPSVTPDAGFDTIGVNNSYDLPEEDIIFLEEEEPVPQVSVSVDVEIEIEDPETDPPTDGIPTPDYPVIVDGNAASVLEGTSAGTKQVVFIINLSEAFTQDVQVTYELRPVSTNGAADNPEDWFDGLSPQTVTIPAGATSFPVYVQIVEDDIPEGNGVFEIVLLSANNATINPDADSAMVTIFDDDVNLTSGDVAGDETDGFVELNGVIDADYGLGDTGTISISYSGGSWTGSASSSGNTVTADDGSWTLVVKGDGTYTFTQNEAFYHPDATNPDDPLTFEFTATAIDSFGNTSAPAVFTVTVDDDAPDMTVGGTDTVAEDAVGTISGTWDNSSYGADDASTVVVKVGASSYALGANIVLAEGTLNVATDGTWTFDPANGQDQDLSPSVTFSVEVTDGDGDVASDNHTITITDGAGPGDAQAISLSVDEDDLPVRGDETAGNDDTPESLTDSDTLVFTLGSDALASMAFDTDLSGLLTNTDGLAGADVIWTYGASQITGTVNGDLAITLTLTPNLVAGTASVSVTLSDNFLHTYGDDIQTNLDLGSVDVIATDIDGDTAAGTVNVAVVDDVPAMTVSGTATVAEDAVGTISGTWDNSSYGADDASTVVVKVGASSYALGANIVLAEGTLNVATDGTWTFDPANGQDQDLSPSVTFSVEVTDGDGDVASDNHTITITDGAGPGDAQAISLLVDEDDLPMGNDDTPESLTDSDTLVFTLGSDALASMAFDTDLSGLLTNTDGLAGADVIWTYGASQITGTVNGDLAITLTLTPNLVAGTASVSVTLSDNFLHTYGDDIQTNLDLGSVDVIATDIDGDTAAGTVNVAVVDDVPVAINPEMTFIINQINTTATGVALDVDSNIDDNVGADQLGTLSFTNIAVDGTLSQQTTGNQAIYLYSNGSVLIASTLAGSDYATVLADTNTQVYTVTLNTDGDLALSNDTYDFTLLKQLDGGLTSFSIDDGSYDFAGGNTNYAYYFDTDVVSPTPDILVTPVQGDGYDGDGVNATANEAGVDGGGGGQNVGGNEGIRIDFVSGISGTPVSNADYDESTGSGHTFTNHETVFGVQATLVSSGQTASTIELRAYQDPDGNNIVGDGTQKDITSITLGGLVTFNIADGLLQTGDGYTVEFDYDGNGSLYVSGIYDGTTIQVFTGVGLNSLEIDYLSDNTFSVGGFGAAVPTPGDLINLDFDLQLVDADGDTVIIENGIEIQISPEDHVILSGTDGNDQGGAALIAVANQATTILGGDGDDELVGGGENDILIGGAGDDVLTGNAGVDVFDFNEDDLGVSADSAADTITDFNEAQGDIINLADVLANTDNTIAGVENGGHLQIQVTNASEGGVVQTIDVTSIAVLDDAAAQVVLNSLLISGAVDDGI